MNHYPKVFCVEGDPLNRMVVEILLREKMGLLNVVIFSNSDNFEERIDEFPFVPDIILLDIHLKPLNGSQMLGILRQHPVYQLKPIVALTDGVIKEEVEQLQQVGFDGFLAKPLNEDTFPNTLQRLLGGEYIWGII